MKGFSSRPKIPRTPDVSTGSSGRPSSGDVPPLTRSISPSRPDSKGKHIQCWCII